MPNRNIFKKLNIPPLSSPSLPVPTDPHADHIRVRTSREVQRSYRARQAVRSTATGLYVLSQGRNALSESALAVQDPQQGPQESSGLLIPAQGCDPPSSPGSLAETSTAGWTSDYPYVPDPETVRARHRSQRANQATKWKTVVLPALIDPYYTLLQTTDNLADIDRRRSDPCTCSQTHGRALKVVCVHFDGKFFAFTSRLLIQLTHIPRQLSSKFPYVFASAPQPLPLCSIVATWRAHPPFQPLPWTSGSSSSPGCNFYTWFPIRLAGVEPWRLSCPALASSCKHE